MKRVMLALLPVIVWAGAPSNSVTITSQGAAQPGRPITVNRWFAKGEIGGYAKPVVRGVGTPAAWQNDVKIRWRDGKTSIAVSAATNTKPIKITAVGHGFQDGERVMVSGVGGNTAANGTWTVQKVSANTFELLNSAGNGNYTVGGTANGPASGSLKHSLISFRFDLPSSSGSSAIDFVNDPNPCSSGSQSACNAAGLDAAGMLAFNGGSWVATTQTTASSVVHSASARTMLGDPTHVTPVYWLRGPAVTQVILEDPAGYYDWGYAWSTDHWINDATNKGLHPMFILTFYTGWAGVKVEYAIQNVWSTTQRDQTYDVVMTNSSGTADSLASLLQWANTMWRRPIWDGAEPGGVGQEKLSVKVDLNLPYLIYAKTVPPLMDYTPPSAYATALLNQYDVATSATHGPMYCPAYATLWYCGNIRKDTGSTGGSPNIGLINGWDSIYLRTMDPQHRRQSEGNADHNGAAGWYYYRENGLPSGYFDHAGTAAANGRWESIAARPSLENINNYAPGNMPAAVGAVTSDRVDQDTGHHAGSGMAYILSGEWWHLQVALGQGAWSAASQFAAMRRYSMGLYHPRMQPRYYAWPMRDVGYAALIAPDGTAEQAYFQYIVHVNVAYWEGTFNVRNSRFYSEPTSSPFRPADETGSAWQLGRYGLIGMGQPNPLGIIRNIQGTEPGFSGTIDWDINVIHDGLDTTSFMNWYWMNVYSWFAHVGLADPSLPESYSGFTIGQLKEGQPTWNPYYSDAYNGPAIPFNTPEPVTTAGISDSATAIPVDMIPLEWQAPMVVQMGTNASGYSANGNLFCGNGSEYIHICSIDRGALTLTVCDGGRSFANSWCYGAYSFTTGSRVRSGRPFQSWAEAARGWNSTFTAPYASLTNFPDNKWYEDEGYATTVLASMSWLTPVTWRGFTGFSAWDWIKAKWIASGQTCMSGKFLFAPYMDPVKVRATMGDTFVVLEYVKPRADEACTVNSVSDGVTSSRLVRFVKTGLTAGSSGSLTIACASDTYGNTAVPYTTLSTLSGTGSYSWTAPGGNTRLNYGATSALGTSTAFADCSAGCAITAAKGLLYVQIQRAGGAAGEIRPVLIP